MVGGGEDGVVVAAAAASSSTSGEVGKARARKLRRLESGDAPKGDVLATARIAGIMAAKRTSDLIPLCHPLMISKVSVDLEPEGDDAIVIEATVSLTGKTGVEMEALTAVSVACLTIYDMLKAADKGMVIEAVRLELKTGGKSGEWRRLHTL